MGYQWLDEVFTLDVIHDFEAVPSVISADAFLKGALEVLLALVLLQELCLPTDAEATGETLDCGDQGLV